MSEHPRKVWPRGYTYVGQITSSKILTSTNHNTYNWDRICITFKNNNLGEKKISYIWSHYLDTLDAKYLMATSETVAIYLLVVLQWCPFTRKKGRAGPSIKRSEVGNIIILFHNSTYSSFFAIIVSIMYGEYIYIYIYIYKCIYAVSFVSHPLN